MSAVSVIIPANDEGAYIGRCLQALLESEDLPDHAVEILVVPNGCTDATAEESRLFTQAARGRGWQFQVIELAEGNKIAALNAADAHASGDIRIYLDADVTVSPTLLHQLARALSAEAPRYASGTAQVVLPTSPLVRAYAGFWQRLPFFNSTAPGFGVYAVNAAGRARWGRFPPVISDDTFVRLSFAPDERVQVAAPYFWPMAEGVSRLIGVRRRQDRGVAEIRSGFPQLLTNDDLPRPDMVRLFRRDPFGFVVYATVALAVRLLPQRAGLRWARGRPQTARL